MRVSRLKRQGKKVLSAFLAIAVFAASICFTPIKAKAATTMKGSGTASDPYIVTTPDELQSLSNDGTSGYYKLGNDIDLSNYSWNPISSSNIKSFDGCGYKIKGLHIGSTNSYYSGQYAGLFGDVNSLTVKNVVIEDAQINNDGTQGYSGILIGLCQNTNVTNCAVSGTINNANSGKQLGVGVTSGGLIGYELGSKISNCYANATVIDNETGFVVIVCGGFIGDCGDYIISENASVKSKVTNCYSTSTIVHAQSYFMGPSGFIGGFVGSADMSEFDNCYETGQMYNGDNGFDVGGFCGNDGLSNESKSNSEFKNCYWNKDSISCGIGKILTAENDTTKNDTTIGYYLNDMKSQRFADILNSNFKNNINLSGCRPWLYSPNINKGFPYFSQNVIWIDNIPPALTITPNTTSWTKSVTLTINAADDNSGVTSVTKPDGTITQDSSFTYPVSQNGTYTFSAVDNAGNKATQSITVNNIDTTAPAINYYVTSQGDGVYCLSTSISDGQSGIASAKWAYGNQSASYFQNSGTAISNPLVPGLPQGIYTLYARDYAGNETVQEITLDKNSVPSGSGSFNSGWTNQNVTIHFTAVDDGNGIQSITTPDGKVVNAASANYTVSENGVYSFTITDRKGNSNVSKVTVSNIDKTPPTGSYTLSKTKWTCGNVTISVTGHDDLSGVAKIILPNGNAVNASSVSYTAVDNGTYNFTVVDYAGNATAVPVTVKNIDRTIAVTHPLSIDYSIDPNTNTLSAPSIDLHNNSSHIGAKVSVLSMQSTGLKDTLPENILNWFGLNAAQTSSQIALGIKSTQNSNVFWAASKAPVNMGTANINGNLDMTIQAKYGLAWSKRTQISTNIVYEIDVSDVPDAPEAY